MNTNNETKVGKLYEIFFTLNPHLINLSHKQLLNDFRYCLQQYYRKSLGRRYYKHVDEQFDIMIFPEDGHHVEKEPHLHTLINIPLNKMEAFFNFVMTEMKKRYINISFDLQESDHSEHLIKYCTKEKDQPIYSKSDLLEKATA